MNTLDEIAKILAITAGLLGSLITSQMAQGYDFSDMQRMGMSGAEARIAMQMTPQDRADFINKQIDSIGGEDAVQKFGGRNYSYPKVDANTVDTQRPTGNLRSGGNARPNPTANVTIDSGDAETLQKNARLLRDVLPRIHLHRFKYINFIDKVFESHYYWMKA
jgi:hypothetical protein